MLSTEFLNEYKFNNKSGKMLSEKYVIKHYPKDYDLIIKLNEGLPFKLRVYNYINGIEGIPLCKNINCHNQVKFKNSTLGYNCYCSNRKCIGSDPDIIKKKEKKSIKKWGTKNPAESSMIKEKIIKTNKSKYGGNSPMSSNEVLKKSKETLIKNWGVSNPSKNKELLEKRIKSFKNSNYLENFKKTSLEKYGVDHPWKKKEIHNKSILSFYKGYEFKIKNILKENYNDKYTFKKFNIGCRKNIQIYCNKCGSSFDIENYNFYFRYNNNHEICINCNPLGHNYSTSKLEKQVVDWIKSIYDGEIITNTREVISPYELDIYLPDKSLAIEFNGLFWHSEFNKDKKYHQNKTLMCEEKGIHLIHIWEDSWILKNDIIKSIILNHLNLIVNKVGARSCQIEEVSTKMARRFLENNHIQGYSSSSIKIGLFYKGELISLMTFGKKRISLNHKNEDGHYELIRFVNKINWSVMGGASKLFKYFIDNYHYKEIVSYSDNSLFDGSLYSKLGFNNPINTDLDYYWVLDNQRHHRYNFRKSKLVSIGYNKNKTEREIMYEDFGSYRIWGCGMKKWIFVK